MFHFPRKEKRKRVQKASDVLHTITTFIEVEWFSGEQTQASGFFYHDLEKSDQPWKKIINASLVTNRHVLINKQDELAKSITFYTRKRGAASVEWVPITVSGDELKSLCKFHSRRDVDVAIVDIDLHNGTNQIAQKVSVNIGESGFALGSITPQRFPSAAGNKINIDIASGLTT